jgi:hypothetical protein
MELISFTLNFWLFFLLLTWTSALSYLPHMYSVIGTCSVSIPDDDNVNGFDQRLLFCSSLSWLFGCCYNTATTCRTVGGGRARQTPRRTTLTTPRCAILSQQHVLWYAEYPIIEMMKTALAFILGS